MDKQKAQRVLEHLQAHNMGFCFVDGVLITIGNCLFIINK